MGIVTCSYKLPRRIFGEKINTRSFSYKQRFFSSQSQCCLTFSWIEIQMLLKCCLNLSWRRSLSYRKQSIDLLCISMDWFLYKGTCFMKELIHISIIILRDFFYLLYMCPCLDQGLFMSYVCDLFFIFIFIFIMINQIILWINTRLLFCLFFRICPIILDDNVDEEWKKLSNN